jgi:hypothetical protein
LILKGARASANFNSAGLLALTGPTMARLISSRVSMTRPPTVLLCTRAPTAVSPTMAISWAPSRPTTATLPPLTRTPILDAEFHQMTPPPTETDLTTSREVFTPPRLLPKLLPFGGLPATASHLTSLLETPTHQAGPHPWLSSKAPATLALRSGPRASYVT